MTNRDVYAAALHVVCESDVRGDTSDYEERAPYLLATLISQLSALDAALRDSLGVAGNKITPSVFVGLDEEFPLCDSLYGSAVYYLAAMLVIDENETLYERLFALYSDSISLLQDSQAFKTHPIVDVYGELI